METYVIIYGQISDSIGRSSASSSGLSGSSLFSTTAALSTVTKWKQDPAAKPSSSVVLKLCKYFDVSASELLDSEEESPDRPRPSREDIKFALFGGSGNITEEMYKEVLSFAAYVRQREEAKQTKQPAEAPEEG